MQNEKILSVLVLMLAVACGSPAATDTAVPPTAAAPTEVPTALPTAMPTPSGPLTLTSDAFEAEGEIAASHAQKPFTAPTSSGDFVCTGSETDQQNISPALAWKNAPPQTKSLALIMVDDMHFAYPDAPEGSFFPHWTVYNLPPDATGLAEAQSAELSLPE